MRGRGVEVSNKRLLRPRTRECQQEAVVKRLLVRGHGREANSERLDKLLWSNHSKNDAGKRSRALGGEHYQRTINSRYNSAKNYN